MVGISDFPFTKIAIFSLTVMTLCFWAGDSIAQSEQEKSEMEQERPITDKPLTENHSDVTDLQTPETLTPTTTTAPSTHASLPKKDNHLSGEGKKPETAPSTLSFNIFLYIVDKFKAD